jgi:hypothetical protein
MHPHEVRKQKHYLKNLFAPEDPYKKESEKILAQTGCRRRGLSTCTVSKIAFLTSSSPPTSSHFTFGT